MHVLLLPKAVQRLAEIGNVRLDLIPERQIAAQIGAGVELADRGETNQRVAGADVEINVRQRLQLRSRRPPAPPA